MNVHTTLGMQTCIKMAQQENYRTLDTLLLSKLPSTSLSSQSHVIKNRTSTSLHLKQKSEEKQNCLLMLPTVRMSLCHWAQLVLTFCLCRQRCMIFEDLSHFFCCIVVKGFNLIANVTYLYKPGLNPSQASCLPAFKKTT